MPNKSPKTNTSTKKLSRSSTDVVIAGVAGGLGEYFKIDPTLIRIAFVLITLFGGSGIIVYLVLWLVIPKNGNRNNDYEETIKINADEIKQKAEYWADEVRERAPKVNSRLNFGWIMFGLGIFLLLSNFGVFRFFRWDIWWPVIVIGMGLFLLSRSNHE